MHLRLVTTKDGSHSLINETLQGESYHNLNGARTESQYVFIDKGLACFQGREQELAILEIGLGTGLNVLLTALQAPALGLGKLHITSLEPFPLPAAITQKLNFAECLPEHPHAQQVLTAIHACPNSGRIALTDACAFSVHHQPLESFEAAEAAFDLVYFDAFAPAYQGELWARDQLTRIHHWMRPGAILVTYGAMGQFKRDLKALGMQVERLPGCLGKREMTRASKPA